MKKKNTTYRKKKTEWFCLLCEIFIYLVYSSLHQKKSLAYEKPTLFLSLSLSNRKKGENWLEIEQLLSNQFTNPHNTKQTTNIITNTDFIECMFLRVFFSVHLRIIHHHHHVFPTISHVVRARTHTHSHKFCVWNVPIYFSFFAFLFSLSLFPIIYIPKMKNMKWKCTIRLHYKITHTHLIVNNNDNDNCTRNEFPLWIPIRFNPRICIALLCLFFVVVFLTFLVCFSLCCFLLFSRLRIAIYHALIFDLFLYSLFSDLLKFLTRKQYSNSLLLLHSFVVCARARACLYAYEFGFSFFLPD